MNWGQNKFIISFGVVMLAGCGTLGGLLWQAGSQFGDLNDEYNQQLTLLQGLQNQPLYPEQSNLDRIEELKDGAIKDATEFQAQLVPMAFPLEPISPEQFQDKLRATVSAVSGKAAAAGMKLPDKFYLGFNDYQGKPPTADAAPALNRELKAIELAVNTLIENKVGVLTSIKRDPLPEETDESKGHPGMVKPQPKAFSQQSSLLSKFPFDIQFTADQAPFQRCLNALCSNRKQFFVVKSLAIKNSVDKPILKEANSGGAVSVPAQPANGQAAGKDKNLKFLVGAEKLSVSLRLEMVVFANTVAK